MIYWIGQCCGFIATAGCIVVPFFHHKWQMLVDVLVVNLLMMLNFILIGQIGAAAYLCGVATVQSALTLMHNLRGTEIGRIERCLFLLLYLIFGFYGLVSVPGFVPGINLRNLLELMPICGALLNMAFISVKDPCAARKILLLTNIIWATYSAIVGAAAFFAQVVTLLTTLWAMYRYRDQKTHKS